MDELILYVCHFCGHEFESEMNKSLLRCAECLRWEAYQEEEFIEH